MKVIRKPIKEDPVLVYNKLIITEQATKCPFCKSKFPTYIIKDLSDYDPWENTDVSRKDYKQRERECCKVFKDMIDIKHADQEDFHTLQLTCSNNDCQAQWETDYMYWKTNHDMTLIRNYLKDER